VYCRRRWTGRVHRAPHSLYAFDPPPPRAPQGGTTSTTNVDPIELVSVLPATTLLVLLFRQRHQLSVRHRPRRRRTRSEGKSVWRVLAVLLLVVSGHLTGGLDGVPAGRTEVTGETLRRCGDDGVLLLMREAWGVVVPVREMARNQRLIDSIHLSPHSFHASRRPARRYFGRGVGGAPLPHGGRGGVERPRALLRGAASAGAAA
jgi:hypothetical protein